MMRNVILAIAVAFALVAIAGTASAITHSSIGIHQTDAETWFNFHTQVEGCDSSDWPNHVYETPTASLDKYLYVHGDLDFIGNVWTDGTGLAWPDRNSADQGYGDLGLGYGEWSMYEQEEFTTTGKMIFDKEIKVWTVHPDWFTNFQFNGGFNSLTTQELYAGRGTVGAPDVPGSYLFQAHFDNGDQEGYYEPVHAWEQLCINEGFSFVTEFPTYTSVCKQPQPQP